MQGLIPLQIQWTCGIELLNMSWDLSDLVPRPLVLQLVKNCLILRSQTRSCQLLTSSGHLSLLHATLGSPASPLFFCTMNHLSLGSHTGKPHRSMYSSSSREFGSPSCQLIPSLVGDVTTSEAPWQTISTLGPLHLRPPAFLLSISHAMRLSNSGAIFPLKNEDTS